MSSHKAKHVFFILSPITLILSLLIAKAKMLNDDDVIVIYLRGFKSDFFKKPHHLVKTFSKRLFQKLRFKPMTREVLKIIGSKNNFLLYTPWCFPESAVTPDINILLNNKKCLGHFYIEEGQLSYEKNFESNPALSRSYNEYFREDNLGFYAIFDSAFPKAPLKKKIILSQSDLSEIKRLYTPKLLGTNEIGITCSERRLKSNEYKKMLNVLISHLDDNSAIKFHPSFESDNKLFYPLREFIKHNELNKDISVCDRDIIIEFEMMYEKKTLIGSMSSLKIYADFLNSSFKEIDLY